MDRDPIYGEIGREDASADLAHDAHFVAQHAGHHLWPFNSRPGTFWCRDCQVHTPPLPWETPNA